MKIILSLALPTLKKHMITRFLFFFLLIPSIVFGQDEKKIIKKLGSNPIQIMDSARITREDISHLDPKTIASIKVLYDNEAIKAYGNDAADGVIIFTSKNFARERYTKFFRTASVQYDSLYNLTKSDSTFLYIINDKIKTENWEGDLLLISNDLFISMQILTDEELKNRYNITDKQYGIYIKSKRPEDLSKSSKKRF
ncbi:hypothetical protein [Mucilaginibacter glaciei]|uniref:TonB-dependent receptor plug domain-containing protein n=1 Tax=Mucilaginibacter glaciei TaxID=2772109 RepID=A0A926NV63_9SPHI|nr:hypothetical protein [Mucilaginibacter glaciei]MBD1392368.1 hypothetical protein [Mucilaginibacter glaciei]